MITDLLNSWEETYKKGQLTLWIFLSLKDGDKYVDEIKYFIENPIKITEMGLASRDIVVKRFDVRIINSQLLDVIENAFSIK